MRKTNNAIRLGLPLLLGAVASADNFELSWYSVDGGGEMFTTGGKYELSGTIGQPDSELLRGVQFELAGGFWFPILPGDCNTDVGVDLFDYRDSEPCLSGPGGGLPFADCNCFDLDGDGDVDLSDVAGFQMKFTGG